MSYTKFVIIGQERTGSNLLQTLLASHSNILSFGEIFNVDEQVRKKALWSFVWNTRNGASLIPSPTKELLSPEDVQILRARSLKIVKPLTLEDNPAEYLAKYVYKEYPDDIKAVGFRLFYSHARNDEWKEAWEYLKSAHVKIIHLKRKNLLDRYLSYALALRSNVWISYTIENDAYNEPITLDPADCFKDLNRSLLYQQQIDGFFENNLKLEVTYEALHCNLVEENRKIQQFLGLEYQELSSKTIKQRIRKKTEIIANYNALKQQLLFGLANSKEWAKEEWLDFFTDE